MRRRRTVAAAVFMVVALVALVSGAAAMIARKQAPRGVAARARAAALSCGAPALGGTLPAMVYLPAGYSSRAKPYPVIYFLHGLPASPESYKNNSFVADAVQTAGRRAIVVAPQGARSANSDAE